MKTFNVPKAIIATFGVVLGVATFVLMILASNEEFSSIARAPIEPRAYLIMIYAALSLAIALWLYSKAFAEKKKLSAILCAVGAVVSIASIIYGIMRGNYTVGGTFGGAGALLLLATLLYGVICLYKNGCKKICMCIEIVFCLANAVLTVGAAMLLTHDNISPWAVILLIMTLTFALASAAALVYRFVKQARGKWIKILIAALLSVGILSYTAGYTAALYCTQSYYIAYRLPTGLIVAAMTEEEAITVYSFGSENTRIGVSDSKDGGRNKFEGKYFSNTWNYSEYTVFGYQIPQE